MYITRSCGKVYYSTTVLKSQTQNRFSGSFSQICSKVTQSFVSDDRKLIDKNRKKLFTKSKNHAIICQYVYRMPGMRKKELFAVSPAAFCAYR